MRCVRYMCWCPIFWSPKGFVTCSFGLLTCLASSFSLLYDLAQYIFAPDVLSRYNSPDMFCQDRFFSDTCVPRLFFFKCVMSQKNVLSQHIFLNTFCQGQVSICSVPINLSQYILSWYTMSVIYKVIPFYERTVVWYNSLKGPSHQIRFAWKSYGCIGLG